MDKLKQLQKLAHDLAFEATYFAEDVQLSDFIIQHAKLGHLAEQVELKIIEMSEHLDKACKELDVILEKTL